MKKLFCLLLTVTMLFGMLTSCLPIGARHEETETPTTTESPTTTAQPDDGKPTLLTPYPICESHDPNCFYRTIPNHTKFFTNFEHKTDDMLRESFEEGFVIDVYIVFDYPCLDTSKIPKSDMSEACLAYYAPNNKNYAEEVGLLEKGYGDRLYISIGLHDAVLSCNSFESYIRDRTYLQNIAQDPCVRFISVKLFKEEIVPNSVVSTSQSSKSYTMQNVKDKLGLSASESYNGTNIKVGIIETSLPTPTGLNLVATYGYHSNQSDSLQHANDVTALLQEIASGVRLYCVGTVNPNPQSESERFISPKEYLEWLMVTCDVDVINMSSMHISYSNTDSTQGYYTDRSGYFDYMISQHGCLVIISAGNTTDPYPYTTYVDSEACAANVLSVGACNIDDKVSYVSSHHARTPDVYKPDLVAPGEKVGIYGTGTSFAAPIVTGVAALLLQEFYEELEDNDLLLKAVLIAGCEELPDQTPGYDEYTGAGQICYVKSRAIMIYQWYYWHEKYPNSIVNSCSPRIEPYAIINAHLVVQTPGYETTAQISDEVLFKYGLSDYTINFQNSQSGYTFTTSNFTFSYENDSPVTTFISNLTCTADMYRRQNEYLVVAYFAEPHEHAYSEAKVPYDELFHRTYCPCLKVYIDEGHDFTKNPTTLKYVCTVCGYIQNSSTIQPWKDNITAELN